MAGCVLLPGKTPRRTTSWPGVAPPSQRNQDYYAMGFARAVQMLTRFMRQEDADVSTGSFVFCSERCRRIWLTGIKVEDDR